MGEFVMNVLTKCIVAILAVALMSGCAMIERIEKNKVEKLLVEAAIIDMAYTIGKNNPDDIDTMLTYCQGIIEGGDQTMYDSALQYAYHYLDEKIEGLTPGTKRMVKGSMRLILEDLGADETLGGLAFDELDVKRLKWVTQRFAYGLEYAKGAK